MAETTGTETRGLPVRGEDDDAVHRAEVGPDAIVDPAGIRTACGQRVVEVYNDGRDITCAVCGDVAGT